MSCWIVSINFEPSDIGLHRVAGDAEGGEEEDLREEPKGDQNHQSEK